ncbi:MAG TPA: universal stress protein [Thermoanaerobaculia bacterium]|jgi:nucleotide-binding universal stress UspA family protein|nr:universal stress protein [Thermoanaerobaculia bacterium]
MFRRILIPTDFSTASEWVFDDAVRIAGVSGAELVIVHVRMTRTSHPGELRFPADASLYEYAEQQELDRLRDRVRRANASLSTRLIVRQAPDPGEEICDVAKKEAADLIVIATHARHHVAHLFVGSTTLSVLDDPPCPVLAIRYGIRKRQALNRAVVPVHLEQTSHTGLELATRVAKEVHLLIVCDEDDTARAEALLREMAAPLRNAQTAVVQGSDVDKEIIRYATRTDADAIFLNALRQPNEGKLDIVRHATVPVMIVP